MRLVGVNLLSVNVDSTSDFRYCARGWRYWSYCFVLQREIGEGKR